MPQYVKKRFGGNRLQTFISVINLVVAVTIMLAVSRGRGGRYWGGAGNSSFDGNYPLRPLDNYTYSGNKRSGKLGDGIGIYISNKFQTEILNEFNHMSSFAETVFLFKLFILRKKKRCYRKKYTDHPKPILINFLIYLKVECLHHLL